MSREYIAAVLKRLRAQTGLTADEVGAIIGAKGKTVNAWENNRGQPDAETLIKLCDVYGVANILDEFREEEPAYRYDCDIAESYAQLDAVDRADVKGYKNGLLRADKYNKSNNQSNAC